MPLRRYEVTDVRLGNGHFLTRGGAKYAKLSTLEVKYLLEHHAANKFTRKRDWIKG